MRRRKCGQCAFSRDAVDAVVALGAAAASGTLGAAAGMQHSCLGHALGQCDERGRDEDAKWSCGRGRAAHAGGDSDQ